MTDLTRPFLENVRDRPLGRSPLFLNPDRQDGDLDCALGVLAFAVTVDAALHEVASRTREPWPSQPEDNGYLITGCNNSTNQEDQPTYPVLL